MTSKKKQQLQKEQRLLLLARRGLSLSEQILTRLRNAGISCDATLRIVATDAGRSAIHGRECGGAVAEMGHYVGFCKADGSSLGWRYPIRNFMPNGPHAVVVAEELVRLDMYRFETSYDLLITRHSLKSAGNGRAKLWNDVIFYARFGTLERELWGKDKVFRGGIAPDFYSPKGEPEVLPPQFRHAVFMMTGAVTCTKCRHCHLLVPPTVDAQTPTAIEADIAAATP